MKIPVPQNILERRSRPGGASGDVVRRGEAGSALLVVLVLLLAMTAIVVSNQFVLRHLKREIKLIEQQQMRKYEKVAERTDRIEREDAAPRIDLKENKPLEQPAPSTNAPPADLLDRGG